MHSVRSSLLSPFVAVAVAAVVVALTLLACGPAKRPDGGEGLLPVGTVAPEVVGFDVKGTEVRLSAATHDGKKAVVYFYPKDASPGCTTEACAFRDAWDSYVRAGIVVIGVSSDSAESHKAFLLKKNLPFALASDESLAVSSAYGVPKHFWGDARVTFLIGADGKIAHVWPDVDPGVHAGEVLATASSLPAQALPAH
jgi:peroxiredoxin Q/BCP